MCYFPPKNVCPDPNGPIVTLSNNETIRTTHKDDLPFATHLSPQVTKVSHFPYLHNNLISVGQLCDNGCTVTFDKTKMTVSNNSKPLFYGHISTTGDGLWNVDNISHPSPAIHPPKSSNVPPITNPSLNNVTLWKFTTTKDVAIYLHAACFSSAKHTFPKAIKITIS